MAGGRNTGVPSGSTPVAFLGPILGALRLSDPKFQVGKTGDGAIVGAGLLLARASRVVKKASLL